MMMKSKLIGEVKDLIKKKYFAYFEKGGGKGYRYYHAVRVADNALRYVNKFNISLDKDVLVISCLLHDIGKTVMSSNTEITYDSPIEEHCVKGSQQAENILTRLNASSKLINHVKEIILNHHDLDSELVEIKILQNADDLDEFGMLNVWRILSYSFQTDRSPQDSCHYWFSVYETMQSKIASNFSIPFFKELALKRVENCNYFFTSFSKELNSND
ncbi:MAG: HD domain-containing protein [Nanoarchaeota archaeon]|nr:HD domain-containing protein [Nanoarchaeota archaeon]